MKTQRQLKIIRSAYLDLELLEKAEEITRRQKTNITRAISEGLRMWVDKNSGGQI